MRVSNIYNVFQDVKRTEQLTVTPINSHVKQLGTSEQRNHIDIIL